MPLTSHLPTLPPIEAGLRQLFDETSIECHEAIDDLKFPLAHELLARCTRLAGEMSMEAGQEKTVIRYATSANLGLSNALTRMRSTAPFTVLQGGELFGHGWHYFLGHDDGKISLVSDADYQVIDPFYLLSKFRALVYLSDKDFFRVPSLEGLVTVENLYHYFPLDHDWLKIRAVYDPSNSCWILTEYVTRTPRVIFSSLLKVKWIDHPSQVFEQAVQPYARLALRACRGELRT